MISADKYEYLFKNRGNAMSPCLQHDDVVCYRTRTIKAGNMLEIEAYPLWKNNNQIRVAKNKISRPAQQQLNAKNAKKRFTRLVNANFSQDDICITLTYTDDNLPGMKQARRDVRNYLRRIRTYRRKSGYSEIKYVYVTEIGAQTGRIHHHIIMSAIDRDVAEAMWPYGRRNSKRLQPDDYGLMDISAYCLKSRVTQKRWVASRNLVEPTVLVSDTILSKREIENMVQDIATTPAVILCDLYPDYALNDCVVTCSSFVSGAYIYAIMHRSPTVSRGYKKE